MRRWTSAVWCAVALSGPERKAAAAQRLPPEPPQAGAARVALQLPSGRAIRRFSPEDTVSVVFDYALTRLGDDEAANEFDLVASAAGAEGLAARRGDTVAAAGLNGMMLRLQWQE